MPEKGTLAMLALPFLLRNVGQFVCTLLTFLADGLRYLRLCLRPSSALAAENLILRQQLALYHARHVKPRRTTNATRLALICLARWFDWRQALIIVQPATLIRWHRQGFCICWRWKSRPGCPWVLGSLGHRRICLCCCKDTGTEFQSTCRWWLIHS